MISKLYHYLFSSTDLTPGDYVRTPGNYKGEILRVGRSKKTGEIEAAVKYISTSGFAVYKAARLDKISWSEARK